MKKKVNPYLKSKIKSENFVIVYFVAFLFILVIAVIFRNKTNLRVPFFPNTGTVINTPFVSTNGTKLYANGELYQFTGVNVFNLASYTGNAGCGGQVNDLDAFFYKLRPNSTVRMWAFQGSMATNTTTKLTDWTGLDRVVAAAQKDGIKLILALSDQSGTCDDGHWKDSSWYAGGYAQSFNDNGSGLAPLAYIDYVKLVVNRYKDSTAVAMWEPVNEPQASDCAGAQGSACYSKITCNETVAASALRSFFDTVGGAIKAIDKNHLVSSGVIGGGQCGAQFEDYKYLHSSPGIDVASYHDYDNDDSPMPGDQWNGLQKRLDQMALINKPLIIGEVGMKAMDNSTSCMNYATRRDKLKAKMAAQFSAGIAGFMPWDLTGGVSAICNFDIVDNDPTIALLHDYPISMGTVHDTQPPTNPTNLSVKAISPNQVTLNWTASTDNVGVVRYDIFRNSTYWNTTTTTTFSDNNLNPSATYVYFVKGKDAAGNNSGESNSVTIIITPDVQAPSVPAILSAISPNQTEKVSKTP